MILSIIVLDSTFLTGIIGIELGLVVLTLTGPLLLLANKMYMTLLMKSDGIHRYTGKKSMARGTRKILGG